MKIKHTLMMPMAIVTLMAVLSSFTTSTHAQQMPSKDKLLGRWINEDKDRTIEFTKKGTEYSAVVVVAEDQSLIGKAQITRLQWDGETYSNGKLHVIKKAKTYRCTVTVKDSNTIEISGKVGLMSRSQTWIKIK